MYWLGLTIQITGIALLTCIVVLLWRRSLLRTFPLFSSYALYMLLATIAYLITLPTPRVYFYVYWITTPLAVILAILAVHESFRRVFRVFYLVRWFRFCFPGAIVLPLLYSVLMGYLSPPVQARGYYAAIISGMMTAQYIILAISLVFFGLVRFLQVPWRIHEYRIVAGFALSSGVTALAAGVRSVFGTRFSFVSEMLPGLTYLVVLGIWLSAAVYPLPVGSTSDGERPTMKELTEVVSRLREDLAFVRALLRRR